MAHADNLMLPVVVAMQCDPANYININEYSLVVLCGSYNPTSNTFN